MEFVWSGFIADDSPNQRFNHNLISFLMNSAEAPGLDVIAKRTVSIEVENTAEQRADNMVTHMPIMATYHFLFIGAHSHSRMDRQEQGADSTGSQTRSVSEMTDGMK
jgi:hypothetical protein